MDAAIPRSMAMHGYLAASTSRLPISSSAGIRPGHSALAQGSAPFVEPQHATNTAHDSLASALSEGIADFASCCAGYNGGRPVPAMIEVSRAKFWRR
jgi:hypothetical protein